MHARVQKLEARLEAELQAGAGKQASVLGSQGSGEAFRALLQRIAVVEKGEGAELRARVRGYARCACINSRLRWRSGCEDVHACARMRGCAHSGH